VRRPLIPKPAVDAVAVPSCRYMNLSRSPPENRSDIDDADTAAVHIQLPTAAATSAVDAQPTDAVNESTSQPPAPVCGGYIVIGPDTFGRLDDDFTHEPLWPRDSGFADSALASGLNPQQVDLTLTQGQHQQLSKEETAAENDSVNVALPSVNSSMQGNSMPGDSGPVTNYAMIVGMSDGDLNHSSMADSSLGQADKHPDNGELRTMDESESPLRRSVSDDDDVTVQLGPPANYSLNSGGYLSHSELLGAAAAV